MKRLLKSITMILLPALILTGCSEDDNLTTNSSTQPQSMKVRMTDNPGDYLALDVELESVQAFHDEQGWITLESRPQLIAVLSLTNGKETLIAQEANIEAGHYSYLKLTFGETNTLTLNANASLGGASGSGEATVDIDYPGNREVIVEIDAFISADAGSSILLDFDVAKSITKANLRYTLNPEISVVKNEDTGVKGLVKGSENAVIYLMNEQDTLTAYANVNGEFLIRGASEGLYNLKVMSETNAQGSFQQETITGIPVMHGEFRNVGTIEF